MKQHFYGNQKSVEFGNFPGIVGDHSCPLSGVNVQSSWAQYMGGGCGAGYGCMVIYGAKCGISYSIC